MKTESEALLTDEPSLRIHCDVPRVGCAHRGKTTQASVPWAQLDSGFMAAYEASASWTRQAR